MPTRKLAEAISTQRFLTSMPKNLFKLTAVKKFLRGFIAYRI